MFVEADRFVLFGWQDWIAFKVLGCFSAQSWVKAKTLSGIGINNILAIDDNTTIALYFSLRIPRLSDTESINSLR